MFRTLFAIGLLSLAMPALAQPSLTGTYAWAQVVDNGRVLVRAVTDKDCDALNDYGVTFSKRSQGEITFPTNVKKATICEATFTMTASPQSITVDSIPLTIPGTDAPERVLVIGDTGCRQAPAGSQDCANNWFFKEIADSAAQLDFDLIVHVGDFTYRDNCWNGTQGCKGADHALQKWGVWQSDFFDPARVLLTAAPWAFVRGNHEDCAHGDDRAWAGWSAFFSSQPVAQSKKQCETITNQITEHVTFNATTTSRGLNLHLLNDNRAKDTHGEDFAYLDPTTENWMLTHVPFWSKNNAFNPTPGTGNADLMKADLVLSGHVHLYSMRQAAPFGARYAPVQIVQGASGTKLEGSPGGANGAPFYYVNNQDFSVTVIERDASDVSTVTLCTLDAQNKLGPIKSWTVTRTQTGSKVSGTNVPVSQTACPAA